MFTGLIDHCGKILQVDESPNGKQFLIACDYTDLQNGESIAVNGACLTALSCTRGRFQCDVSPETLKVTAAGLLKAGNMVNLERSLRMQDRLGGHFVLGHVDQTCVVVDKKVLHDYTSYTLGGVLPETRKYLVYKGSIAVNGVSLTLNSVAKDTFSILLIPETLKKTNLAALEVGDYVNVEYDYLAKIVCNQT